MQVLHTITNLHKVGSKRYAFDATVTYQNDVTAEWGFTDMNAVEVRPGRWVVYPPANYRRDLLVTNVKMPPTLRHELAQTVARMIEDAR